MMVKTPLGQVLPDREGMRLEFVRTYDASVDQVWSALTDPGRVGRWIGTWSGDPATGRVDFQMLEDEHSSPEPVTILECEPPTRLVVVLPSPDGPWRISVTLESQGEVTALTFTQDLTEPYDASSVGPGWHYYLDRLGAVVLGLDLPERWDDYYPALKAAYALPGAE